MEKRRVVDNFMYYIFNVWCEDEAVSVFGNDLGTHIYEKWCWYRNNGGDQLEWYANLDEECRTKIVERACEYYGK